MKKIPRIALLLAGLALLFASCSNGSSPLVDESQIKIYATAPYSSLSEYMQRAIKATGYGCTTAAPADSVPTIFIVRGADIAGLSDEAMLLAAETCFEGKTFVIDSPTEEQVIDFASRLDELLEQEGNEYYSAMTDTSPYSIANLLNQFLEQAESEDEDGDDFTAVRYEAIGMRQTDVYFAHDVDEEYELDLSEDLDEDESFEIEGEYDLSDADTNTETNDAGNTVSASDIDNYDELLADSIADFAEWLKETGDESADAQALLAASVSKAAASQAAVEDAKKAQRFVHGMTATFKAKRDHYDGRYDGKSEHVQVIVEVWSACAIDDHTDHYLVRTYVTCNNNELGYKNDWSDNYHNKKNFNYKGPYMRRCTVRTKMNGATLLQGDCSPQTTTGSTNFTTSQGFAIAANAGFNASGPTGGLAAGWTNTKSNTTSIPDIKVTLNCQNYNATWTYDAPAIKPSDSGKCDDAKAIQRNAAIFDTYAHYTRDSWKDADKGKVKLDSTAIVSLQMVTGWLESGWHMTCHYGYGACNKRINWHDRVRKPSNSVRNYTMWFDTDQRMTPSDLKILGDTLKEYIPAWGSNVPYYGVSKSAADYTNLNNIAKAQFAIAMKTIENNKRVLKSRGFSGTFTFNIKGADDADSAVLTSKEVTF